MPELRPIAAEAITRSLLKAERYRLLNEPREAESICRDCLAADAGHQEALRGLILSLTDLFSGLQINADEARALAARLTDEFDRRYYGGVVEERWGKALLASGYPKGLVYEHIAAALRHFDAADAIAPPTNDDAALRWNACVRMIDHHGLGPEAESAGVPAEDFDDDVPMR